MTDVITISFLSQILLYVTYTSYLRPDKIYSTTCATSGAGTAYLPEFFTPRYSRVHVARSLGFLVSFLTSVPDLPIGSIGCLGQGV